MLAPNFYLMKFYDEQEARTAIKLAIGRIFRMSFNDLPYDDKTYNDCRAIIIEAFEYLEIKTPVDKSPSYQRDYFKLLDQQ